LGHDRAENVFQDMVLISEHYRLSNFKFTDEALHPAVLESLSKQIVDAEMKCCFEGYARFDRFWQNESFLRLVSKAGLKKVYLGLELIKSKGRDLLNKADSENALEMLQKFHDAGIRVHLFTMFGFPGTGVDDALNTVEFALEHRDLIDTLDIFPFHYAKHTTVPRITPKLKEHEDWAIEYDYEPTCKDVLEPGQVHILCEKLEQVIWQEQPEWLHPTYRMISPFGTNCVSAS